MLFKSSLAVNALKELFLYFNIDSICNEFHYFVKVISFFMIVYKKMFFFSTSICKNQSIVLSCYSMLIYFS